MDGHNFFQDLLDEFKDDLDFKVEGVVLDITEQICKIMDEQKINRADLSRLLNTSKSAVTKMLNGSTNFTLKRLLKITTALDKELSISFKEPKKVINFNYTKEPQCDSILTATDPWIIWDTKPNAQLLHKGKKLKAEAA